MGQVRSGILEDRTGEELLIGGFSGQNIAEESRKARADGAFGHRIMTRMYYFDSMGPGTDTLIFRGTDAIGMDLSHDELAGIVDLFGGLTESEVVQAVEEFGFRMGEEVDAAAIRAQIELARSEFALLLVEFEGAELLVVGPTAFPTLPEGAEDLPHVLDVSRRTVPQETLETAVRKQMASAVLDEPEIERANELIDITYDAEAWAGIDLSDVRARLEDIVAGPG